MNDNIYGSIEQWKTDSPLFSYLNKTMESSTTNYYVTYGKTGKGINGFFDPNTNTIVLDENQICSAITFFEEFYHMYQQDQKGVIDEKLLPMWNREYEAKLCSTVIASEVSVPFSASFAGIEKLTLDLYVNPQELKSLLNRQKYIDYGSKFVNANYLQDSHYTTPVTFVPQTFINAIHSSYEK